MSSNTTNETQESEVTYNGGICEDAPCCGCCGGGHYEDLYDPYEGSYGW